MAEQESQLSEVAEREKKPPFDALVVHVYFLKHDRDKNRWVPDLASKLAIAAAAHLYQEGVVGKLIITAGRVHGVNTPATSFVFREGLERRFHIPPEDILTQEKALDTKDEVKFALEEARKNGLKNLLVLGIESHLKRIKRMWRQEGVEIAYVSSERILHEKFKTGRDLVQRIARLPLLKSYQRRERLMNMVGIVDRGGHILHILSRLRPRIKIVR